MSSEAFRLPLGTATLASAAFALLSCPAAAQPEAAVITARPTVEAIRIDTSEAPVIDGDLSDPAWANAAVLEEFLQREPVPRAPPTERTVLRIMYDADNLYFGIYAYDSEPDLITVRAMARDGAIYTGDNVLILLDPGLTRRNAYAFQFGPSGGRRDALRLNNTEELAEWDTIWTLRTQRVSDGWIAEVAIPFRSLSYTPGQDAWGFEFARSIRRKTENIRWASHNPALNFADISEEGTLTGITDVNRGFGLDIQPYALFGAKHNWQLPGDGAGITATFGGNAFYKITPALTGTLTVNTDFSDAPLDARQVNTTRFSLFIPETRDFFLQDAGTFEFGGRGFSRGFADRTFNNGRPFFSRNIGLVNGAPVSLIAGGKLSGEFAGFGIGALTVMTGDTPASDQQLLSAMRVTRPILSESKLGFVFTNGDPTGVTDNSVAGVDFQYRDSSFLDDQTLTSDFFYERSFSDTQDDASFGVALNLPNEPWGGDFTFKQLGENFFPALGFVNRTGIRLYDGTFRNTTRYQNSLLRQLTLQTRHQFVTGLDNELQSRFNRINAELETDSNDTVSLTAANYFEHIVMPFDLPGEVPIPAGDYTWTAITGFFQSSQGRPVAFRTQVECCHFYDGDGITGLFRLNLRPNEYFETAITYEPSFFDLPGGKTEIHLYEVEGTLNFTPDMQLALQIQYDNISHAFGSLARFRWEYTPGNEVFVAIGQSAFLEGPRFEAQATQLTLRLIRTFRF